MKKVNNVVKGIFAAGLLVASSIASAQWTVSGGYANYGEDDAGIDVSLGAIYASAGYEYTSGNITFMPELRLGVGVRDDIVRVFGERIDVEIDTFFAASIRGQYNVTESFGVFLQPTYARVEATASTSSGSVTEDEWELGFGGGASFSVTKDFRIEALYESFDEADVLSLGVRVNF